MTGCGFTPDQIDGMTMLDVKALFEYWRDNPPTHEALKIVYKIERKEFPPEPERTPNDPSGIGSLVAQFPGGHVPANR